MATNGHTNGHANGNGVANGAGKRKYTAENYPTLSFDARYKGLSGPRDKRIREGGLIGGYYKNYNLSPLLEAGRWDSAPQVDISVWTVPHSGNPTLSAAQKPTLAEAKKQTYKPVKKGDGFGPNWSNHWFRVVITIPDEHKDAERVVFEFDLEGEAMVFDLDGNPYQGLTGGTGLDRRVDFIIPEKDRKAGKGEYYIEASCNGMFGVNDNLWSPEFGGTPRKRSWELKSADLVVPNMEAVRLFWDYDYLVQLGEGLSPESPLAQVANHTANEMLNTFRRGDLASCAAARKKAERVLGANWEEKVAAEGSTTEGTLWAIGHCHIDTAWLWPYSVTQQKAGRSWSAQCDLIDRYPEYVFSATQPQQFKWVEQLYPDLWKRIQSKVEQGRFQPLGATWVEMDTNLPSGEAIARQFLYGQRYFQAKFGARSKTFVLPDTFGYSSQLPQISRLSGAPNFFTQKLSWNDTNNFPHSTFNWSGIDGSQVLTHMTPVDTYCSQAKVEELRKGLVKHKNAAVTQQSLLLFGNGDGGGGPTEKMLENLRRTRAVNGTNAAAGELPRIKNGGSFDEFYDAVRAETANGATLPSWHGELYLEIHRATYTTGADVKKGNRKAENRMREAEYAATMASIYAPGYTYPKERIDAAWEDLLLSQFHDVLPGSSIHEVYVDTQEIYAKHEHDVNEIINEAYTALYAGSVKAGTKGGDVVGLNTTPGYPRAEVVQVPAGTPHAQSSADGKSAFALLTTEGSDIAAPATTEAKATATQTGPNTFELANSNLKVTVADGRITSIVDVKLKKELIDQSSSAGFVIYEDQPNWWDAWDVDEFHLDKATHLSFDKVTITEAGPLRATLRADLKYGDSTFAFDLSLDALAASDAPNARSLLRVDAQADWHTVHEFLKFELPLTIHSLAATYDTQFGVLQRNTHRNTSWDAAQFEVCGHKYADVSEWGYGVALINESRYGYAARGNLITLSLLRGPVMPDPVMDMGEHTFSFAIYPHVGSFGESDVPAVATAFNLPLTLRQGVKAGEFNGTPFTVSGARNVTLEAIKRGEDDTEANKSVIIRLFEQFGGAANATLNIANLDFKRAEVVNILEDHIEELEITRDGAGASVELPFRGFEIKTVRLTL
ncbi:Alpha-mannosidase [Vanrija pseudolonga]|uniref:Alpha-mannosidase n=1 Tax=Vanrija pseudolonga TaxID=143232 RepID=A0AAF0Y7A2_9TREE|nr:Alpha-mannosidase [Vanrija pseudolonga]